MSSYQLTKYPVGSQREIWAISWPLMAAFISTSFMMFVDRLFLAHFDPMTLNAAASAGIAYYIFLVVPMGIAAIAEVLVGRLHGKEIFTEVGSAAWQMIWFGFFLTPLFLLIGWIMPDLLFSGTGNELYETTYFRTLLYFAPLQCINIAISGFFIGIGKVKTVTLSAIFANIVNVLLAAYFIFGHVSIPSFGILGEAFVNIVNVLLAAVFGQAPTPSYGILGAAFATGIAQLAQMLFLFCFFLSTVNRKTYFTQKFLFNFSYLFEGLRIGTPSGLGHCMEIIAHFLFFRIVMSVGPEHATLFTMIQSLYMLFSFVCEAESKAASVIVANLLGADMRSPIKKVLVSALSLHTYFFLLLIGSIFLFPEFFLNIFASTAHQEILSNPVLSETFWWALFYICLFFLFDGFGWILIGFLTASGDTRFVFLASVFIHWFAYVLPTFWIVGMNKGGADRACSIIATMGFLSFMIYLHRYQTGAWLKKYSLRTQLE